MADKFESETAKPAGAELPISRNGEAVREMPSRNAAPAVVPATVKTADS